MRSYYAHLETAMSKPKTPLAAKPTYRASSIFPVINQPGISSRILFMGYWMLKRNIQQIAATINLRSEKGELLYRTTLLIQETKAFRIELKDLLVAMGESPDTPFVGSLEVEFFSTMNLVFPYPATVINYYGPNFSSVVHTAQRVYNDFDDMRKNSETDVPESGFNIYADEDHEPFFGIINGPEPVPQGKIEMQFFNAFGEMLTHTLDLGTIGPYQLNMIYPARLLDLQSFLRGKVGAGKIRFHVNWIFPRVIAGNMEHTLPAVTITHTYYDCTAAKSDSDFWMKSVPGWHPASMMVPVCIAGEQFTRLYFYPIYSPSAFDIDIEFYDFSGKLLGGKKGIISVRPPFNELKWIDMKAACKEAGIEPREGLTARIIAKEVGENRIPSRIKTGLDIGTHLKEMPCNICNNLQPFVTAWETKPSTFRWAPMLTDRPTASLWIFNSSPQIDFQKPADIQLSFFRDKDTASIKRQITLPPHGTLVIHPDQDPELKEFFGGQVGWATVVVSNPYATTYYFSHNPSGVVGGDHGF